MPTLIDRTPLIGVRVASTVRALLAMKRKAPLHVPIMERLARERRAELDRKVMFLRSAAAYPEGTVSVTVEETHRSWVFLTDSHAYKLKKPLVSEHFDYSTATLRRDYCVQEVRLNRRLASEVYLGLRPLRCVNGELVLDAEVFQPEDRQVEDVEDWLVMMQRLPSENTLEHLILRGAPGLAAPVDRVAEVLVNFHLRCDRVSWTGAQYRGRLTREVLRYRRTLDAPRFALVEDSLDQITDRQVALLREQSRLFDARAQAQCIVDGHGDLRPEHVFLMDNPVVIDCLEFDRDLRLMDTASELSFLAMECERLGAANLGQRILDVHARSTKQILPEPLLAFYRSHHACIRAVIALWHLDDPNLDSHSKWAQKARSYLHLARRTLGVA